MKITFAITVCGIVNIADAKEGDIKTLNKAIDAVKANPQGMVLQMLGDSDTTYAVIDLPRESSDDDFEPPLL